MSDNTNIPRYDFAPRVEEFESPKEILARHGFLDESGEAYSSVPPYEMYGKAMLYLVTNTD